MKQLAEFVPIALFFIVYQLKGEQVSLGGTVDGPTDVNGDVIEGYHTGPLETNNATAVSVEAALKPYPDLVVAGVTLTPADVELGGDVVVDWRLENTGTADVTDNFTERLRVVNTVTGQTLVVDGGLSL